MSYRGAGPIKHRIRSELYKACALAWSERGRPLGDAVVLAGPDPWDVPELQKLGFHTAAIWLVDHDHDLSAAKKQYPSVNAYEGSIEVLLQWQPKLAFINLDLMGGLTTDNEFLLVSAGNKILPRGILVYTYQRGRECSRHTSSGKRLDAQKQASREDARIALVAEMMKRAGMRKKIFHQNYTEQFSSMSTVAYIK